jgi:gentisate 1,2-dioxygenase
MSEPHAAVVDDPEVSAYYAGLGNHHVQPLWRQLGTLLPPEPRSAATPHVWRYDEMRDLLMRAGEIVSAQEAERRVLMLMNPGLSPLAAAATNLYAGLQLVLPGEVAPAHHHAACALRFVVEGSGGYTAVDGERTKMEVGDLVLTPSWAWHDHGNQSDGPMIWLDGLDLPLINGMEANFFGGAIEQSQDEIRPADSSTRLWASGRLNPTWIAWDKRYSPIVNYPWSTTERILADAVSDHQGSRHDGVRFEYADPLTGGPVMPALACFVQALAPGLHTDAHRHTASAVYHVVSGNGQTIVNGETIRWGPRDTFAVPGWDVHEHLNLAADEPAILFSFTDDPVLKSLGYYREQDAERQA